MEVFERTDKGTPVPDQRPALEGDAGGAVGGMLVGAGVGCQTQRGARATVMRGDTTLPAFFLRPTILLDLARQVGVPVARLQTQEQVEQPVAQGKVHARLVQ